MLGLALTQQSCSIRHYIPKNKFLVNKVNVKGEPNGMNEALYNLSKQKPNARLLFVFRWNMWRYLLFNSTVDAISKRGERIRKLTLQLRDLRAEYAKNEGTYTDKQKTKMNKKINNLQSKLESETTTAEEVAQAIDAPVLLDSEQLSISARQMGDYLWDKGYWKAKVTYKVYTHGAHANVYYQCAPGKQFHISKYDIVPEDSALTKLIKQDTSVYLISSGIAYDKDLLDREKVRVYNLLSNKGYYKLKMQDLEFNGDTFKLSHDSVSLKLIINNPPEGRHRVYRVRDVFVEPEYVLGDTTTFKTKTIYNGYIFMSAGLTVRPRVMCDFIYIRPHSIFREDVKKSTITRLGQLGMFQFVDIRYVEDKNDESDTGVLDCYIRTSLAKRYKSQSSFDLNKTDQPDAAITNNYSSLYGIVVSTSILNRNLGHSAMQFETQLRGAIEVPFDSLHFLKPLKSLLNYQLGLTNSLIFPKLLYPHLWPFTNIFKKAENYPTLTSFNLNLLFEQNSYYSRTTGNVNLTWQITNNNYRFYITPLEVSLVNAHPNQGFTIPQDPIIQNLFDQHIITDFRFAYLYNLQPITNVARPLTVFRAGAEIGGFVPWAINEIEAAGTPSAIKSGNGTNEIFAIKYYTYSKIDLDLRRYLPVLHSDNLAMRIAFGLGLPIPPSTILPFEKRFYVGGTNSIRAWRARDLGPGSYAPPPAVSGVIYDKSGDFKMEGSFEYRFPIAGFLKGAIFTDYGNVWLYQKDASRPHAELSWNAYKEIAVGSGVGLRFDFSFFVFRFDLAVPMRDPSLAESDRWVFKQYNGLPSVTDKLVLNIGIGYPF